MLDAVFNHCGEKFAPWQDVVERGPDSKYYDWFFIKKWPFPKNRHNTREGNYYAFAFADPMPKLNTNHPEVVSYFTELCSYWLKEWQIDGIRFDVGNEVSHSFLKQLRHSLKAVNPEVYLLGEIWHDSIEWLKGDEYDSVMNYPFCQSLNDFYMDDTRTAEDFSHGINRCYSLYYEQMNRVLFNLLDSHDTERLYTRVGKNAGKFYQQLAVLFTMQGSPCIFYGTELLMEGGHDPDCRRCMPWTDIEAGRYETELSRMKTLTSIRQKYDACKSGNITWKLDRKMPRVVWYEKDETIGVVLNGQKEAAGVNVPGKVLFSYGYEDGRLAEDGVIIYTK